MVDAAKFIRRHIYLSMYKDYNIQIDLGEKLFAVREKLVRNIQQKPNVYQSFLITKQIPFLKKIIKDLKSFERREVRIVRFVEAYMNDPRLQSNMVYLFQILKEIKPHIEEIKSLCLKQSTAIRSQKIGELQELIAAEDKIIASIHTAITDHAEKYEVDIAREVPSKLVLKEARIEESKRSPFSKALAMMCTVLIIGVLSLKIVPPAMADLVREDKLPTYPYVLKYAYGSNEGQKVSVMKKGEKLFAAYNTREEAEKTAKRYNEKEGFIVMKVVETPTTTIQQNVDKNRRMTSSVTGYIRGQQPMHPELIKYYNNIVLPRLVKINSTRGKSPTKANYDAKRVMQMSMRLINQYIAKICQKYGLPTSKNNMEAIGEDIVRIIKGDIGSVKILQNAKILYEGSKKNSPENKMKVICAMVIQG